MNRKAKGKDLLFISRILMDGSGTVEVRADVSHLDDTTFNLNCLSITHGTWIACEFSSYVVKLKNPSNDI